MSSLCATAAQQFCHWLRAQYLSSDARNHAHGVLKVFEPRESVRDKKALTVGKNSVAVRVAFFFLAQVDAFAFNFLAWRGIALKSARSGALHMCKGTVMVPARPLQCRQVVQRIYLV